MDADQTWWRGGAFSFEHEIPLVVTESESESLHHRSGNLVKVSQDETVSLYFDSENRALREHGTMLSLYGSPSMPEFGLKLRVKQFLDFENSIRHSFTSMMTLTTGQTAMLLSRPFEVVRYKPGRIALRMSGNPDGIGNVSTLEQSRTRYVYRDPGSNEFVSLSLDRCLFIDGKMSARATFLEASTYTWPMRDLDVKRLLEEILDDNAPAIREHGPALSKYDYFCKQLDAGMYQK